MANAKNPNHALGRDVWWVVLPLHAFIHGAFVYLITGSLILGLAEVMIHSVVDLSKCYQRITFAQDQAIHLGCKVLWAILACTVPVLH